jgi:hypothetical protein
MIAAFMAKLGVALLVFALFAAPLLVAGIGFLVAEHRRHRDVVVTRGKILHSMVAPEQVWNPNTKSWDMRYQASIEFEYEAADRLHKGRKIDPVVQPKHKEECEAAVRQFPAGADVPVYYFPAAPDQGYLRQKHYSLAGYALVFGGLPIAMWALAIGIGIHPLKPADPRPSDERRAAAYAAQALLWYGVVAFMMLHYFVIARRRMDSLMWTCLAFLLLLGLIPVARSRRAYRKGGSGRGLRALLPPWD